MYGLEENRIVWAALEAFYCVTNNIGLSGIGSSRYDKARALYRAAKAAREGGDGWADRWSEALEGKS